MEESKRNRLLAGALALVALAYYGFLMAGYAFPGLWSEALLALKGDSPFMPLSRPLWQISLAPFIHLPGSGLVIAASALSVVWGALAVWLGFWVGYCFRSKPKRVYTEEEMKRRADARWIAGAVTALYLMVSMPVLVVSTRAHVLGLDLCLLLAATLFTLLYRDGKRAIHGMLFSLVLGLGLAEYPTFLLFAPFFLAWWLWIFWRSRSFRMSRLLAGAGGVLVGASLGLAFCAWYAGTDAAAWRGFTGFGMVYKQYLIETFIQLRYSVPQTGWLLVGFLTLTPAIYIFRAGHQEADDLYTNFGLYFFRLVLLVVAVGILFNLPGSPWNIIGPSALLVTPYAITALWFGQLASFMILALGRRRSRRTRTLRVRPLPRLIAGGALAIALAAAGYLNAVQANPRPGRVLNDLADDLLRALNGRQWLVTEGGLETILKWRGYALGVPLHVINLSSSRSEVYQRYIESLFKNTDLKSLTGAGLDPLLTAWLSSDEHAYEQIALYGHPDIWSLRGYAARPADGLYFGSPAESAQQPLAAGEIQSSFDFLDRYVSSFGQAAEVPLMLEGIYKETGRALGLYANNLGFTLDTQNETNSAEKAYQLALSYNRDNLSALHNLANLYEKSERTNELTDIRAKLDAAQKRQPNLVAPRALVAVHGWLNSKGYLSAEVGSFIEQGAPSLGLTRLQQAVPSDDHLLAMGRALSQMDRGDMAESARTLEELLARDPKNSEALRYLFKARLNERNFEECEKLLARLEQTDISRTDWLLEKAYLLVEQGKFDEAMPLFRELTGNVGTQGPAWAALYQIAERQKNEALRGEALEGLKKSENHVPGLLILIRDALARNDTSAANDYIIQARKLQPGNPDVLSQSILLDSRRGDYFNLWAKVRTLLTLDPISPIGNYVLAERYLEQDRVDLAENAMRRALTRGPFPDGLNGLAWILYLRGNYAEGLTLAEQAVSSDDPPPIFLSTCGMLRLKNGQLDAAAEILNRGIEKGGETLPILKLHLAEVYYAQGKKAEAKKLIDSVPQPEKGWSKYEAESLGRIKLVADQ